MTLRQYFAISVGVFIAVLAGTAYYHVPALPFVVILLTGETLLGFQVEDHRAERFVKAIFGKK